MILWNHDYYRVHSNISSALCKAVIDQILTVSQVARVAGMSEQMAQQKLFNVDHDIDTEVLIKLFKELHISPVWVLSEIGDPIIRSQSPSGKIIKALNHVISLNGIKSFPEYYRILGISSLQEYMKLLDGAMELDMHVITRLCREFRINPAAIFSPAEQTPLFV